MMPVKRAKRKGEKGKTKPQGKAKADWMFRTKQKGTNMTTQNGNTQTKPGRRKRDICSYPSQSHLRFNVRVAGFRKSNDDLNPNYATGPFLQISQLFID